MAHRTIFGFIDGNFQSRQRNARHADICRAAGAVNDRSRRRNARAGDDAVRHVVVAEGQPYLHDKSGARKSSGAYYTKDFAVEHLLERALEPALADHLARLAAIYDAREAAALAMLERVGLLARAEHLPSQLSGGQQQRVAIARAIVADPTFLLCDEPTGDLDRKAGDEILDLLQALNREHGKTIIMVTHDPHASARAGRTVHLTKGQLSSEAEP